MGIDRFVNPEMYGREALVVPGQAAERKPAMGGQVCAEPGTDVRPIALRELWICLSLANLIALKLWMGLPPFMGEDLMWLLSGPRRLSTYASVVGCVLVLALVIWIVRMGLRAGAAPVTRSVCRVVSIGVALLVLNSMRLVAGTRLQEFQFSWLLAKWGYPAVAMVGGMASAVVFFLLMRHFEYFKRGLDATGLLLAPLLPMTIVGGLLAGGWGTASAGSHETREAALPGGVQQRLVVVVFDEFDYRLAFETKEMRGRLTELERLRRESSFFTSAYAAGRSTLYSVPGFTTGKKVKRVRVRGAAQFELEYEEGGGEVDWRGAGTLFSAAKRQGARTGIVGWYIPYCRVFGSLTESCAWFPADYLFATPERGDFTSTFSSHMKFLFEPRTVSPLWTSWTKGPYVETHTAIVGEALAAVKRSDLDLVYLHLPMTHAPYFYDARRKGFEYNGGAYEHYMDSLELADSVLGRLRGAMEAAGNWDRTAVIVTADHSYRKAAVRHGRRDLRVPLVVRIPGQEAAKESRSTNNRGLKDLGTAILAGRVRTHGAIVNALRGAESR